MIIKLQLRVRVIVSASGWRADAISYAQPPSEPVPPAPSREASAEPSAVPSLEPSLERGLMPCSSSAAADPAGAALVLSVGKPAASAATVASERLCTVEEPVAPVE